MQPIDVIDLKTREARVFTHLVIVFAAGAPFDLVASAYMGSDSEPSPQISLVNV
jgi:hypothetical protein